jgi:hypothetical protein
VLRPLALGIYNFKKQVSRNNEEKKLQALTMPRRDLSPSIYTYADI